MPQLNQDPTSVVIMHVKRIKNIELLKRLRRMYAGNGPVQSAIITRACELHKEAQVGTVKWDGQPLDV